MTSTDMCPLLEIESSGMILTFFRSMLGIKITTAGHLRGLSLVEVKRLIKYFRVCEKDEEIDRFSETFAYFLRRKRIEFQCGGKGNDLVELASVFSKHASNRGLIYERDYVEVCYRHNGVARIIILSTSDMCSLETSVVVSGFLVNNEEIQFPFQIYWYGQKEFHVIYKE